jgi:general secretion pathway protein A
MIDEAQGLSRGMLEVLRLLLNFETKSGKMLQLVLIGQNELRDNVRAKANLRSRVAAAATLDNLMYEDVRDLIYHRLRVSGATHNRTFPEPIIQQIYTASRGIPRDISIIADAALMRAYLSGKKIIDEGILEAALRDWEAA